MVVFYLDELEVFFPYEHIYPEQYAYMKYLKKTLDCEGHCVLEMPTGTGKTVTIFSLITSYQYAKRDEGKFIYCTRTVAEMEKSLIELKKVLNYRTLIIKKREKKINKEKEKEKGNEIKEEKNEEKNEEKEKEITEEGDDNVWERNGYGKYGEILAIGISARRCMCVNEKVLEKHDREKIDAECRKLTATFMREKKYLNYKLSKLGNPGNDAVYDYLIKNKKLMDIEDYFSAGISDFADSTEQFEQFGLCGYYENMKKEFVSSLIKPGVYTMEELKELCKNYKNKQNRNAPICPYFSAKKFIETSKVIVLNYQYVIDPKVTKSTILGRHFGDVQHKKTDIIVFDEAHNIDSVCLEALSVNIDRNVLNKATSNIKNLLKKIEHAKAINEEKLREECAKVLNQIKMDKEKRQKENGRSAEIWEGNKMNASNTKEYATYARFDRECEKEYSHWANEELCTNKEIEMKKERGNINGTLDVSQNEKTNSLKEQTHDHLKKKRKKAEIDFDDNMSIVFVGEEEKAVYDKGYKQINENNNIDKQGKRKSENENKNKDIDNILAEVNDLLDEDNMSAGEFNPVLIENVVKNIMPGNIRKSEHFLNLMRIIVVYLKQYVNVFEVTSEGPLSFIYKCEKDTKLDTSFFKYCFDRLRMLLNTLQIVNIDEYSSLHTICNFCTLLGNYFKGFVIICEPYPEATGIYDPVIQFACLDSSIAMKYVLSRYKCVVLTSATISPLELYPKLLNFKTVLTASFPMSFDRKCVCPLIVTRSSDLVPLSSQFSLRSDLNVIKNYGILLFEMCKNIPDGIVAYFPSYIYMEQVIFHWYEMGIITNILKYKLIFLETKDIVATTLALHNFKKACDLGKGAVFLSICRGKIAEGIDFDRHYGKCVILFGIPYQYTLSKILKSRLDFLKETYNIEEKEFLTFDAMRQASQCAGRIIRNKKDYGIMIFSDIRYSRNDKKNKLPPWIVKCMDIANVNLTISTAVSISKQFLLSMSQKYKETNQTRLSQTLLLDQKKCWNSVKLALNMDDFI